MIIQAAVIHAIKKMEGETSATIFLTKEALDTGKEQIGNIISALDDSFSKKTLRRAKFSDTGYKSIIADFNNIDLMSASTDLAVKLKDGIQNIPAAKGGYLVFCHYVTANKYLSVFLVRDTNSSHLQETNNHKWAIKSVKHLDLEHFAMGVRINLDLLRSQPNDRYIQLVRGNTDIADYFENWVGLEDKKQETKDGDALYEICNRIELPDNVNSRDDLKKTVFDYVKSHPSRTVNLRMLSTYLYSDENTMPAFCEQQNIDIDGEFKLRGTRLNRFFKVSVSAGGIKLEAPRSSFSPNEIHVSQDGDTVVIRSRELAEKITRTLSLQG